MAARAQLWLLMLAMCSSVRQDAAPVTAVRAVRAQLHDGLRALRGGEGPADGVLAAEVARLEENLAGEEASVRRLEGALEETTQRHGEEAAAMTALVEEHAAR